jgi:hypothetical protein
LIPEAFRLEWPDLVVPNLGGEAEDQLEMRVGGDRVCRIGTDGPNVDAFMNRLKEASERRAAFAGRGID